MPIQGILTQTILLIPSIEAVVKPYGYLKSFGLALFWFWVEGFEMLT